MTKTKFYSLVDQLTTPAAKGGLPYGVEGPGMGVRSSVATSIISSTTIIEPKIILRPRSLSHIDETNELVVAGEWDCELLVSYVLFVSSGLPV